jgi:hypothetical protein
MNMMICEICGKEIERVNTNQRYCGSANKKTGCSYQARKDSVKRYRIEKRHLNTVKASKIIQTAKNSTYADILRKQMGRQAADKILKEYGWEIR